MSQTTVKTAEYRDLIDGLSQAFVSLRSAANEQERQREAEWVKRAARDLLNARCPRASVYDRERADRLVEVTAEYLIARGLNG